MTQKSVIITLTGTTLGDDYQTLKPLYRDEIQFFKDCWRQLKDSKHWSIEHHANLISIRVDQLADYEAIKNLSRKECGTVQVATGKTQQQWADQYGISRSRVHQLYRKWGTLSDELFQNRKTTTHRPGRPQKVAQ